mmetsp:Transcript_23041/g.55491  ORF Transcript_23041/g.55491 Transcript_23041/m.55491 type:complete len:201 (-) Transcript_23041:1027-1629(-)
MSNTGMVTTLSSTSSSRISYTSHLCPSSRRSSNTSHHPLSSRRNISHHPLSSRSNILLLSSRNTSHRMLSSSRRSNSSRLCLNSGARSTDSTSSKPPLINRGKRARSLISGLAALRQRCGISRQCKKVRRCKALMPRALICGRSHRRRATVLRVCCRRCTLHIRRRTRSTRQEERHDSLRGIRRAILLSTQTTGTMSYSN